uniref:Predicted protein n=1 Tax=Hordeum vulgare subsp. vulgare TaxID=112509 RepID=F2DU42_HORVV|nr:predicted protein [Hordeum vulgare subsp. vulgare]
MAEEKGTLQAMRGWVVDHKLRAVGAPRGAPTSAASLFRVVHCRVIELNPISFCFRRVGFAGTLWLTGIAGSIAYNWSRPGMKTSVKLIHARFVPSVCGEGNCCKLCISFCLGCVQSRVEILC